MTGDERHDDEALIARAVRGAARLSPPSAAARERVFAAVRSEWRATVPGRVDQAPPADATASPVPVARPAVAVAGAQASGTAPSGARRRWPLALAASVAVALVAAGLSWQSRAPAGATVAVAEVVRGSVSLERPGLLGGRTAALAARDAVAAGQVLETGPQGAALLRLGTGLTLRLAANSRLALDAAGRVSLAAGTAYVDADPRLGRQPLDVATPHGVVAHLGTQYLVSTTARALEVAVREGRVEIRGGKSGEPLGAAAGELLQVDAAGAAVRAALPRDDARWAWLAALPAPFTLDGASLAGFLDWYARETGHELEFVGDGGAARAADVRLSGSIAGLAPDEALRVVAASAGVAVERDGNRLRLVLP